MRLHEIYTQEGKIERFPMGLGMEQIVGDHVALVGGMRSGNSPANETRLKYIIFDIAMHEAGKEEEAEVGFCELFIEDGTGEILGLVNIKMKQGYRSLGYGEKVLQDLIDNAKNGELRIHDVNTNSRARKFWNKMGIQWTDARKKMGIITKDGSKHPLATAADEKRKAARAAHKAKQQEPIKLRGFDEPVEEAETDDRTDPKTSSHSQPRIDPNEIRDVYTSLKAIGEDLEAALFLAAANNTRHTTIDSAQRAAELEARKIEREIEQERSRHADRLANAKQRGDNIPDYAPTQKRQFSDKFYGNQYVNVARKQLPKELQAYLPIIDKGMATAMTSGFGAGKRLAALLAKPERS